MGYNSRKIKQRAEELSEGYTEARNDAFKELVMDMVDNYLSRVDEDSQPLIADLGDEYFEEFEFPSMWDWAFDQVQSELDDIGDQKHEQLKDERMGL